MAGFGDGGPRLIEIKTPEMRLLSGTDDHRTMLSHRVQSTMTQARDYIRWTQDAKTSAQRERLFGVTTDVQAELIVGMKTNINRDILDREREYQKDLSIKTFDELGEEMEQRHSGTVFRPEQKTQQVKPMLRERVKLRVAVVSAIHHHGWATTIASTFDNFYY